MTNTKRDATSPETITLGRLLAHEFPPREALVAPWLRQGESAMIWAAPGVGKTLLTLTLAVMVAGGGEVMGWKSEQPRKVLFIDGEMAIEDLQERAKMLIETVEGIDREAASRNLHILSRNWQSPDAAFPDLNDAESRAGKASGQDEVLREARRLGAELVILDNFATLATSVADENDAAAMTPTVAFLLRMKQAKIAAILVHHSGKTGETYRGSSKLATTFEVILGLKAEAGTVGLGAAFTLVWTKYRGKPDASVRPRTVRLVKDDAGKERWQVEASVDDEMQALIEAVESCRYATQKDVAQALSWDTSKVTRTKVRAIKAGFITEDHWDRCLREGRGEDQLGF